MTAALAFSGYEPGGEFEWIDGDVSPNGRWTIQTESEPGKGSFTNLAERNGNGPFGPLFGTTVDAAHVVGRWKYLRGEGTPRRLGAMLRRSANRIDAYQQP
jgi:hypothetical protein